MAWFYRGAKKPLAHWFDPGAEVSICNMLKPDRRGMAWRHPQHDRHVPRCTRCASKLTARNASIDPTPGVKDEGGSAA